MILIKSKEQIDGIREAAKVLVSVFNRVEKLIDTGITPIEIDTFVRHTIKGYKAKPAFLNYNGFPAAACISVNDTVIHGIPDKKPLNEGDIVGIDIGVNFNNYIADKSYTFPVGRIAAEAEKLLSATQKSLDDGIAAIIPKKSRISSIGKAVSSVAKNFGYGVVYQYCGHGVGLNVHEEPAIPNNYPCKGRNPRIVPGMVLAIEPMINIGAPEVMVADDEWSVKTVDGTLSAHFEHTVAIHEDYVEVLT